MLLKKLIVNETSCALGTHLLLHCNYLSLTLFKLLIIVVHCFMVFMQLCLPPRKHEHWRGQKHEPDWEKYVFMLTP